MPYTRQKFIKGSQVFYSDQHEKRLLDAIGENVVKYINDFTSGPGIDTAFDNEWTVTRTEAGAGESTVTRIDGSGGFLRLTTDANEDDGINMQLIGESHELTTDQHLYFGAFGVTLSEATQSDFFIGLAITDTDILGGVTDRIGFEKLDGATAVKFMVEKDSTETLSASAHTATTSPFDLEFYWDGDSQELMYFVNGSYVAASAITNLPNDEALRVSLQFLAGSTTAKTMDIDAIRVIQIGR